MEKSGSHGGAAFHGKGMVWTRAQDCLLLLLLLLLLVWCRAVQGIAVVKGIEARSEVVGLLNPVVDLRADDGAIKGSYDCCQRCVGVYYVVGARSPGQPQAYLLFSHVTGGRIPCHWREETQAC